jgi:hypothetical protein
MFITFAIYSWLLQVSALWAYRFCKTVEFPHSSTWTFSYSFCAVIHIMHDMLSICSLKQRIFLKAISRCSNCFIFTAALPNAVRAHKVPSRIRYCTAQGVGIFTTMGRYFCF